MPAAARCPGRPVAEIRDSRLNAEMVFLGSSVGPPPGDGPAPGTGTWAGDPAVLEAAEAALGGELPAAEASRPQFERVLDAWESALAGRIRHRPAAARSRRFPACHPACSVVARRGPGHGGRGPSCGGGGRGGVRDLLGRAAGPPAPAPVRHGGASCRLAASRSIASRAASGRAGHSLTRHGPVQTASSRTNSRTSLATARSCWA